MKIWLALISARRRVGSGGGAGALVEEYLQRAARYLPCEARVFAAEAKLLEYVAGAAARTRPVLILTDSRGRQVSSEEVAGMVGSLQAAGTQQAIVAIGPPDGWSAAALARADHTIAFGRITLPHELAAVVVAEQIYRALTIQAGHPYHGGH